MLSENMKYYYSVRVSYDYIHRDPLALPPFVNRMDFMPKFSQLSYHKQVSKRSTFFRNYVEFHFVIRFYYI